MTALSLVSKGDLAFLCEPAGGGAASVIVDASEQRTNLTNNTTYCSEANSARTAIDTPRTVCVVVDMTSTSQRFIVHHGLSTAVYGWTIDKSGTAVRVRENGTTRVSVTVPGLTASARKVLVHWGQRVEGGNVLSEVAVYNFVTLEWAFGSAIHTAFATTPTHTLTIGASTGGLSAYDLGITAIHAVSIGRRFHSTTESCRLPACGDGIMQAGEACDDWNDIDDDDCSNECLLSSCGDGIVQASEQCDDANAVAGDGCTGCALDG